MNSHWQTLAGVIGTGSYSSVPASDVQASAGLSNSSLDTRIEEVMLGTGAVGSISVLGASKMTPLTCPSHFPNHRRTCAGRSVDASPFSRAPGRFSSPLRNDLIPAVAYSPSEQRSLSEILSSAGKRALGGGLPGMAAMGIQVMSLMWLRTTVNYQYRYGTGTMEALRTLYKQGGVRRFYRGVGPALIQGPMSRFGDTAANAGVLALFESYESTSDLPVAVKTLGASVAAASWRIFLMPVDACKTILQVEGKDGLKVLGKKLKTSGPTVLYHGALAASGATLVGHYPWFFTYNTLNESLPQYDDLPRRLMRSALIGFCSSVVSDTSSNSIRVIKTTKQTANTAISYPDVIKMIYQKDGILRGFIIRGLGTKIITNGLQGILFSVLWRMGMDMYNKSQKAEDRIK
ncbi:hypothetical protein BSKO_03565 [Bryopsis sp. KO-2023]|nr:hypothetical protein BSKO_03565 [Bryopsis sp. KO-2023]